MSESLEQTMVDMDGFESQISLADLAGMDMSGIKEVRFTSAPAGKYHWLIKLSELTTQEVDKEKGDSNSGKIKVPCIRFEMEAVNVFALTEPDLNLEDYIGQKINQQFNIRNEDALGRAIAFLNDIGVGQTAPLGELINAAHGMEFISDVKKTKNKDNPDIVYSNLDNVMSLAVAVEKYPDLLSVSSSPEIGTSPSQGAPANSAGLVLGQR